MTYLYPCQVNNFFLHLYHLFKLIDIRQNKHTATLIGDWMRKTLKARKTCVSSVNSKLYMKWFKSLLWYEHDYKAITVERRCSL